MTSCETIQHKHPLASIHRSKLAPPEAVRNGEEEVIWITSVLPEPDLSQPVFADAVAANVQLYWRHNGIKTFSTQRPYLADPQETDPMMTWTDKTLLTSMYRNRVAGLR